MKILDCVEEQQCKAIEQQLIDVPKTETFMGRNDDQRNDNLK